MSTLSPAMTRTLVSTLQSGCGTSALRDCGYRTRRALVDRGLVVILGHTPTTHDPVYVLTDQGVIAAREALRGEHKR